MRYAVQTCWINIWPTVNHTAAAYKANTMKAHTTEDFLRTKLQKLGRVQRRIQHVLVCDPGQATEHAAHVKGHPEVERVGADDVRERPGLHPCGYAVRHFVVYVQCL